MSVTETTLITWTQGRYNGYSGSAGNVGLFSISWKTSRDEPNWQMRTDLPGMQHNVWKHDDADKLKAAAEKALAGWIARVSGGESQ